MEQYPSQDMIDAQNDAIWEERENMGKLKEAMAGHSCPRCGNEKQLETIICSFCKQHEIITFLQEIDI